MKQHAFPPQHLLVATDMGATSVAALQAARRLQERFGYLFSSTTQKVMQSSPAPVLVVPRSGQPPGSRVIAPSRQTAGRAQPSGCQRSSRRLWQAPPTEGRRISGLRVDKGRR
jgi:hypothetical protein